MAELLEFLARKLVDEPEAVRVERVEEEDTVVLRLHVAQLDSVPADRMAEPFLPGPPLVTLRPDVEGAVPLARPPAALAPEFADGFFLVPRHGAMEDL